MNAEDVKTIASEWGLTNIGKLPHPGDPVLDGWIWRVPINIDFPVCRNTDTMQFRNVGGILIDDGSGTILNVPTIKERETRMVEEIGRVFAEIHNAIPSFDCALCGRCCGPLGMTPMEMNLIDRHVRVNHIEVPEFAHIGFHATLTVLRTTDGGMCPYLRDHKCMVYDVRPTICRLFGVVDAFMVCKATGTHKAAITHKAALCVLDKVDALSSLWVAICNRDKEASHE